MIQFCFCEFFIDKHIATGLVSSENKRSASPQLGTSVDVKGKLLPDPSLYRNWLLSHTGTSTTPLAINEHGHGRSTFYHHVQHRHSRSASSPLLSTSCAKPKPQYDQRTGGGRRGHQQYRGPEKKAHQSNILR